MLAPNLRKAWREIASGLHANWHIERTRSEHSSALMGIATCLKALMASELRVNGLYDLCSARHFRPCDFLFLLIALRLFKPWVPSQLALRLNTRLTGRGPARPCNSAERSLEVLACDTKHETPFLWQRHGNTWGRRAHALVRRLSNTDNRAAGDAALDGEGEAVWMQGWYRA